MIHAPKFPACSTAAAIRSHTVCSRSISSCSWDGALAGNGTCSVFTSLCITSNRFLYLSSSVDNFHLDFSWRLIRISVDNKTIKTYSGSFVYLSLSLTLRIRIQSRRCPSPTPPRHRCRLRLLCNPRRSLRPVRTDRSSPIPHCDLQLTLVTLLRVVRTTRVGHTRTSCGEVNGSA